MRRALITGAAGTLGRALAARLRVSPSWQVVATARSPASAGMRTLDVTCRESVVHTIEEFRPDVVFHLAATFCDDFGQAYATNVLGARNLLAGIEAVDNKPRLVLMGSAAEYGFVCADENPITERQLLRPMTTYGLTKAWQTQLGLMHAAGGADVVVARLFNLHADGMPERLFIGRVQRQIADVLAGDRATIEIGALDGVRDYVMVDEAVDQVMAIAARGDVGSIYHVGSGIPVQMRTLLSRMLASHGLTMDVVVECPAASTHRGYNVPVAYADMAATQRVVRLWREEGDA